MSRNILYDIFEKSWFRDKSSSIWLISDPHFGDPDLWNIRQITPEEQVKRINSKVGKKDTIIFLGDIGDVEYIKKIKGYKVLILGNHDKGASNYKREIKEYLFSPNLIYGSDEDKYLEELKKQGLKFDKFILKNNIYGYNRYLLDNHLFDEVYDGELIISSKIKLSHIATPSPYCLNIHGHNHPHSSLNFDNKTYNEIIKDLLKNALNRNDNTLNICSEYLNFYPINLNEIINSGLLKNIKNIFRELIDSKK